MAGKSGSWLSENKMEHFLVQMALLSTENGDQGYIKLFLVCRGGYHVAKILHSNQNWRRFWHWREIGITISSVVLKTYHWLRTSSIAGN